MGGLAPLGEPDPLDRSIKVPGIQHAQVIADNRGCFGHPNFDHVAHRPNLRLDVGAELEKHLADIGFIPLCDCKDTQYSAFYSNQSIQKPKKYDRPAATTNARLSSMLQYMLCISRFAHYVKVQVRDKVGSFGEPEELQSFLNAWVAAYVTTDASASQDTKARFPLREAKVQVREQPGKPGSYQCVMHFAPHYELDELTAAIRIATELVPPRVA